MVDTAIALVFILGILTVVFAFFLARDVLSRDTGTERMQEIASMIYEGAMAYLSRQYRTIGILAIVTAALIAVVIGAVENSFDLAWRTGVAFLVGAAASALAGYIGMYVAVRSNIRTASAARRSLQEAITVALRGGAVSGFLVVALSLLGVAAIFVAYGGLSIPHGMEQAPFLIVGFGFGASFVALFAQLGGGIYTKAADVGADLVGKVEAGIPEDDPRNAAVIADLVGDNVGDCAGRGADLFESTAAENIGAMILGVALAVALKQPLFILFPLVVRALGLLASGVGLMLARGAEPGNPMKALNNGYYVAAGLSAIFMVGSSLVMLNSWWLALAGLVGIATSIAFVYITQYYTAGGWRPVREIADASLTGPATNIIVGTAVGFETTAATAISISVALLASFFFGEQFAHEALATGQSAGLFTADQLRTLLVTFPHAGGVFGTAIATMGMLMTAAYILAMDTFGPITDNAGGIAEMSEAPASAREITDALDAVGNTTKALTKGYAIGSAALAAFLLFSAYLDKVTEVLRARGALRPDQVFDQVNLAKVDVFVGALIGTMLVFLFSSLAIRAVGRTSGAIIEEVRRQFRENPLIMEGKARPDFARCVDLTTRAALREMVPPGLLAVGTPILVGLILKHEATAGLLMVGTIAGVILATVLNQGGGAWDNAKKFIEAGFLKGRDGQVVLKGSDAHAASVVGDTVGDPFKDTAGPSLHVLVKLLSTITLVLAPIFIAA
ncbi:MAG: sodium-translocating pyrophosphatase [Chloroflexi bacterium]|nr:sodium-translocating pyrophosphatase [Chloroflexota bacterium]